MSRSSCRADDTSTKLAIFSSSCVGCVITETSCTLSFEVLVDASCDGDGAAAFSGGGNREGEV